MYMSHVSRRHCQVSAVHRSLLCYTTTRHPLLYSCSLCPSSADGTAIMDVIVRDGPWEALVPNPDSPTSTSPAPIRISARRRPLMINEIVLDSFLNEQIAI